MTRLGRQADSNMLTGSFHPLSMSVNEWEIDAYKPYGGQKGVVPPRPAMQPVNYGGSAPCSLVPKKKKAKIAAMPPMVSFFPLLLLSLHLWVMGAVPGKTEGEGTESEGNQTTSTHESCCAKESIKENAST